MGISEIIMVAKESSPTDLPCLAVNDCDIVRVGVEPRVDVSAELRNYRERRRIVVHEREMRNRARREL